MFITFKTSYEQHSLEQTCWLTAFTVLNVFSIALPSVHVQSSVYRTNTFGFHHVQKFVYCVVWSFIRDFWNEQPEYSFLCLSQWGRDRWIICFLGPKMRSSLKKPTMIYWFIIHFRTLWFISELFGSFHYNDCVQMRYGSADRTQQAPQLLPCQEAYLR